MQIERKEKKRTEKSSTICNLEIRSEIKRRRKKVFYDFISVFSVSKTCPARSGLDTDKLNN